MEPQDPPEFCDWTPEESGSDWYNSACGMSFVFTNGGPVLNEFAFCPKCGKKMKEILRTNEDEEKSP